MSYGLWSFIGAEEVKAELETFVLRPVAPFFCGCLAIGYFVSELKVYQEV
jgi:hypothetical protein